MRHSSLTRLGPPLLLATVSLLSACGGAEGSKPRASVQRPAGPKGTAALPSAMLPATVLARIDEEAPAPHFARRPTGEGLLVYATRDVWRAQRVSAEGGPDGEPIELAAAPAVRFAALRPTTDGYVLSWVESVAKNHAIRLLELDMKGAAKGPSTLVTQLTEEVAWLDLLPNASGALLLWEILRNERSDVFVTPTRGGKSAGSTTNVLRGVLGWDAVPTARGAAFATVVGAPPKSDEAAAKLGRVEVVEVDATGKAGPPVAVTAGATAQIDVDLAEVEGRLIVAWTDERDIDASVQVAAVAGGKVVVPAKRATAPLGDQALVALVPGAKRALLCWEDLIHARADEGRVLYLAPIGPDAEVSAERARMVFSASGPPDLVADGDGFAAVTLAPAGTAQGGAEPASGKPDDPIWPMFVRFGPDLTVRASEPVRATPFPEGGVPYLTRGLSCVKGACATLASGAGLSAPLALVQLPVRPSAWRAPAWRERVEGPPRAISISALYDGQHLSDVAATTLANDNQLVAWVTYFLEGSTDGGKKKAKPAEGATSATLAVRPIVNGAPGKPTVISQRARSIGGVAMAAAPAGEGKNAKQETAIAWVARERNEPQVFVTKVGPDGAKLAQKMVTVIGRRPVNGLANEVADVAIAWADDGWTVAWIDTRDGNAEVYAAKVDRDLKKIIPDRRVTDAPGDAAEVQISVRGKDTFLAFSDARSAAEQGDGDIFVARLETRTLKKLGEETRVFASAAHSRSPKFASGPNFLLGWIEEPEGEEDAKSVGGDPGLRVAQLDDTGKVSGAPALVRGEQRGPVTSAAIACPEQGKPCRGVLTTVIGEALSLGAFELPVGSAPGPIKSLASLGNGVTEDVAPTFASASGEHLFFADDAAGGSGRVRWMTLAWP